MIPSYIARPTGAVDGTTFLQLSSIKCINYIDMFTAAEN